MLHVMSGFPLHKKMHVKIKIGSELHGIAYHKQVSIFVINLANGNLVSDILYKMAA